MSRPVYFIFDGWYYKIIGTILAFVGVFVVIPMAIYFPITKPFNEHHKEIASRIEQGDVDYVFEDISELTSYSIAYSQGAEYKGKIVSFTCVVSYVGHETYNNCHPGMDLASEKTGKILASCRVSAPNKKGYLGVTELKTQFSEGDRITVIGEVAGGSYGILDIDNCKIIKCS